MNHYEIRLKTIDRFMINPKVPVYYKRKLMTERVELMIIKACKECNNPEYQRRHHYE